MIDLVYSNSTAEKSFSRSFFVKIFEVAIDELGLKPSQYELSVNLVEGSKIKELNKRYRQKDKATDVLSFPIAPSGKMYDIMPLGDIFICPSFVRDKLGEQKLSFELEIAHLTVHGFLHLLGYDHGKSLKEAEKMEKLEHKILSKIYN